MKISLLTFPLSIAFTITALSAPAEKVAAPADFLRDARGTVEHSILI
jgi:hypothetical protein